FGLDRFGSTRAIGGKKGPGWLTLAVEYVSVSQSRTSACEWRHVRQTMEIAERLWSKKTEVSAIRDGARRGCIAISEFDGAVEDTVGRIHILIMADGRD